MAKPGKRVKIPVAEIEFVECGRTTSTSSRRFSRTQTRESSQHLDVVTRIAELGT